MLSFSWLLTCDWVGNYGLRRLDYISEKPYREALEVANLAFSQFLMASLPRADNLSKNARGRRAGRVSHAQRFPERGRALPCEQSGVRRSRRQGFERCARSLPR